MPRVKRGVIKLKRRKNVLARVKGYRFGRSTKEAQAKEAIRHAGTHSFRDRKKKKRVFRQLWQTKINAAVRERGLSYSKFIDNIKKKGVAVDRKILAEVAENHPEAFSQIVEQTK